MNLQQVSLQQSRPQDALSSPPVFNKLSHFHYAFETTVRLVLVILVSQGAPVIFFHKPKPLVLPVVCDIYLFYCTYCFTMVSMSYLFVIMVTHESSSSILILKDLGFFCHILYNIEK